MKAAKKIITRSWVHKDGGLVEVDTLSPEERVRLGTALALEYYNTLFAGRAVFEVRKDGGKDDVIYF